MFKDKFNSQNNLEEICEISYSYTNSRVARGELRGNGSARKQYVMAVGLLDSTDVEGGLSEVEIVTK